MHSSKNANLTSISSADTLKGWWLSLRPKTLVAAVVPVLLLTHLAYHEGSAALHGPTFLMCLAVALFLQIATNLLNDLSDSDYGSDTINRKGPLRGLQLGILTRSSVKKGAFFSLILAAVVGGFLLLRGGWPFLILGVASLVLCYGYTAGWLRLARRGLGDLFVLIFFGWVAGMGSYYLQNFTLTWSSFVLSTQVGLLATILIAINNFRDLPEDAATGKHTLAVRLGEKRTKLYIMGLFFSVALLGLYWWPQSSVAALIPIASLSLFALLIRRELAVGPGHASLNKALALAGANQMIFALAHILAWELPWELSN